MISDIIHRNPIEGKFANEHQTYRYYCARNLR